MKSRVTIPTELLARLDALQAAHPAFDARRLLLEALNLGVEVLEAKYLPEGAKFILADFRMASET